jgi:broad specificity phosphatase PhoE
MLNKPRNAYLEALIPILDNSGRTSSVLLIRHAERSGRSTESTSSESTLTEAGIASSIAFGQALEDYSFQKVISSPIPRCVQTGEMIIKGLGMSNIVLETDTVLGDPGCYVLDRQLCAKRIDAIGIKPLLHEYISNGTSPGLRSLETGSKLLLGSITKQLDNAKGMTIMISHDAIIIPFIAHFLGYNFNDSEWLEYLQGPLVLGDEKELQIHFKGMMKKISG